MRIEENASGGETVILQPGDDAALIPDSHRDLMTPAIRDVLSDPVRYFRDVAGRLDAGRGWMWSRQRAAEWIPNRSTIFVASL